MQIHKEIDSTIHNYKRKLPKGITEWPIQIKEVAVYIHKHLFVPDQTIASIYERCNISDKNFAGKFSAYTGFTPQKYRQYHRIECAKRILKRIHKNRHTIVTIALKLGYSNHSAFTSAFKSQTGMTPSRWIAENNQGKS